MLPCRGRGRVSGAAGWDLRWCDVRGSAAVARPGADSGSGVLGESEDLVAVVGDDDGVLELGRAPAVTGDDGPAVLPHLPLVGAEVEHRFDGERHAGLDDGVVVGRRVVVRDDETGVELQADAVSVKSRTTP